MKPPRVVAGLFGTVIAIWLVGACNTSASSKSADGFSSNEPLTVARAFGVHDARIAKVLAPAESVPDASAAGRSGTGFDARGASYGRRSDDPASLAMQLPSHAAGPVEIGVGKDPRFQLRLVPRGALATSRAAAREGVVTYREGFADTDIVVASGRGAGEILYILKSSLSPKGQAMPGW